MKKLLLLFVGMLLCITVLAQQVTLRFTGRDANNNFIPLDRVVITNVSKNWQEILYYPDTIAVLGSETGIAENTYAEGFALSQNNPNPFEVTTNVVLTTPDAGEVTFEMSDVNGHIMVLQNFSIIRPGTHSFTLNVASSGTIVLTARQNGKTSSIKMVNKYKGSMNRIEYDGNSETKSEISQQKSGSKGVVNRPFDRGDHLRYVGYVNVGGMEYTSLLIDDYYVFDSDDIFLVFDVEYGAYDYVEMEQGGTSITTCNAWITDDGGSTGDYQINFDGFIVINPATAGQGIALEGTYNTEFGYDYIYIYSGIDTTGNLLGIYTGSGVISLTHTGALTIHFISDGSNTNTGFVIRATCYGGSSFSCGIVADYDGNIYNTVRIGQQCWMKENLRTTHYANGVSISAGIWNGSLYSNNRYYYYPANNINLVNDYGYLYNWAAVMYGSNSSNANPSGIQGICPSGWHVPSVAEWTQLEDYVGGQSQYMCGTDNDEIAKALAYTAGWKNPQTTYYCAPGNNQNANNATGFSALPAGSYNAWCGLGYDLEDTEFSEAVNYWSTTTQNNSDAQFFRLYYNYSYVLTTYDTKGNGFSVRCLKDDVGGSDGQPCSGAATVTDIDNNTYNTVQIGQQCWMKENLRTTRYANGTTIPLTSSSISTTTSYRYNPHNDASTVPIYGYLYNWPALMHGASGSGNNPSGVQGICPTGWHVPSNAEWTQLESYVSSQTQYQCNSLSYNIAKSLASTTGWYTSTETCAVGNNLGTNNATGFSVFPAGQCFLYDNECAHGFFGSGAKLWSATQAYTVSFSYSWSDVFLSNNDNSTGCSVRCLRD